MRSSGGFSLIELLIVVAIITTLAAIALPQFAVHRQRGSDAVAESSLRSAATAEEALFAQGQSYLSCGSSEECQTLLPGYRGSDGVNLSIKAAGSAFTGTSRHDDGSGKVWTYDSQKGRIVFSISP